MNKRRRNSFSDNKGNGDLADVNELELAKDGDISYVPSDNQTGRDDAKSESLPEFNASEVMSEDSTRGSEFIIVNVENGRDTDLPTAVESKNTPKPLQKNSKADKHEARKKDDGNQPPKSTVTPPARKKRAGGIYVAVIVICLILSVCVLIFGALREDVYVTDTSEMSETQTDESEELPVKSAYEQLSAEQIYELGVKATVTVRSSRPDGEACYSGVGILEKGYVATLYEAVYDAQSIEIVLWDGSVYPAELVGGNSTVNIALLKTQAQTLECASVGSAEELSVGNPVYAIGNVGDGNFHSSLIACRVSFSKRLLELTAYDGTERRAFAIQISGIADEALKGCPVFNSYGEAVALTLVAQGGASAAFSMPLDTAAEILEEIKSGREPSAELVRELAFVPCTLGIVGEQAQAGEIWGVSVLGFSDESSDASRKLREGDLIFRINDTLISDTAVLREAIQACAPGDSVEVFVYRQEQRLSFFVVLS